jgi:uncharacterized protein (PEP-CTERM system associated)
LPHGLAVFAAVALAVGPALGQEGGSGSSGLAGSGGAGATAGGGSGARPASALPAAAVSESAPPVVGVPSSVDRPDVRVGPFASAPFATGLTRSRQPGARAYDIVSGVTLGASFTDSANAGGGNRSSELSLFLTPFVRLSGETARLQGAFSLAPSFIFNTQNTQPNRVATNFLGTGTAEVIPGSVFVDVRGAAFLQPIVPGATTGTVLPGTRSPALQQNFVASISPYWIQRYGDIASSIVGYQLTYNSVSGSSVFVQPGGTTLRNNPGETLGQTLYSSLRTGERFGRFGAEARVNASFFSGGGPTNDGARNIIYAADLRYAVTRTVVLLGEIGYQDIRFGGVPGFSFQGLTGGAGVRLDPSENSTIIAIVRSRAGFWSPLLDARFSLGPRTLVFGRYAEDVGNATGQAGSLLNSIGVDSAGNPVSAFTGAPQPQIGGQGTLATTGGVSRNRIGTASITRFLPRDSITLQYLYSERIPLSASAGQVPFLQTNNTVSATWQRPFSELTSGFASLGYTWTESTQLNIPSESFTATAGISHRFGRRLSGNLVYQFTQRTQGTFNPINPLGPLGAFGAAPTTSATQNTVLGSLSLQF